MKLYQVFVDGDADLVEINPLILTPEAACTRSTRRSSLDDNARFRHPEWDEFTGLENLDERERAARARACSTSASRARRHHRQRRRPRDEHVRHRAPGRRPAANFLDIGGGQRRSDGNALEVINNDPNVKSIFINIFGGITKGEEVANGIVQALEQVDIKSPIVILLDGTNAEKAA